MSDHPEQPPFITRWLAREPRSLHGAEWRVLDRIARRHAISRDTNADFNTDLDLGARMADRVARFGGSWTFIGMFALALAIWTGLNLALGRRAFDPYPFIFLNLVLSMLAAIQAPIIMMSQNRQGERDRIAAAHDYEVNLKAELEIMGLHEKLDRLRAEQLQQLIVQQQRQLELLTRAVEQLDQRK